MRTSTKLAAMVLAGALTLGAVAGCAQQTKVDVNANTPAGAAKLMPVSHQGRFDQMGANGCYGCHGANASANPMLKQSTALPADHYTKSNPTSMADLDGTHILCNTCHAQGYTG